MTYYFTASITLLMSSVLMATVQYAWSCGECDNTLREEIDNFYDFHQPQNRIEPAGPCSGEGYKIAKVKRPVFALESWIPERSTCPWEDHYEDDLLGVRYPCRLHTARLVTSSQAPHRCLRKSGRVSPRASHRCEPLLQHVPVIVKAGCRQGCVVYERRNVTVAVGFTCVIHPHSG